MIFYSFLWVGGVGGKGGKEMIQNSPGEGGTFTGVSVGGRH